MAAHSADVRIHLHLDGRSLPVAELGPDFIVLRDPIDHPPADAEIEMSIDGRESRWRVRLVEGIEATEEEVRLL